MMAAATAFPIASSRPALGPPTTALPPLPSSKARRRSLVSSSKDPHSTMISIITASAANAAMTTTALPRPSPNDEASPSGLRRPRGMSPSVRTTSDSTAANNSINNNNNNNNNNNTVPSSPTLSSSVIKSRSDGPSKVGSAAGVVAGGRDVRRSVSLAAFPHPPNAAKRKASLLISPLSSGNIYIPAATPGRDAREGPVIPVRTVSRLKRTSGRIGSTSNLAASAAAASKTSNGLVGRRSMSTGPAFRISDTLSSLQSCPPSPCLSMDESDSTTATTFEDSGDNAVRGPSAEPTADSRPKDGKGNVIVSVRVRPDVNGENVRADGEWLVDGRRSVIAYRGKEGGTYGYDHVFAQQDKNAKVYDSCAKRLVRRVMEGYHGTVFAYGMTGTGKTFSMQGTASSPGVIPLAITDIFSYIRETPNREFLLRVSYLEIYNEKIYDLLSVSVTSGFGHGGGGGGAAASATAQQEEIKLREDSKRGVYASPLKEEIVQSPTQLLRVIARGDLARRTSSTQYNVRSSRSHAVVQIVVESRERQLAQTGRESKRAGLVPGGVRVSTLSLIDLAGSERAAESKERRQEGAHINKSLLTLGTVIARLSGTKDKNGKGGGGGGGGGGDKDGQHLPYRDSKLTRLLQPALSGNSLISILCTVQVGANGSSAAPGGHTAETLNTLKFAARAKNNIVSHAKRAEEAFGSGGAAGGDAASRALLDRYRMEIQGLRHQLETQAKEKREEDERLREKEVTQRHEEQMLEMQLARTALKERIEHLNRLILCSKSTGVNASGSHLLTLGAYGAVPRHHPTDAPTSPISARSSTTTTTTTTRSIVGPNGDVLARAASTGSTSAPLSATLVGEPGPDDDDDDDDDDEDSVGEYGDGTASLATQVRALQADLCDRNRYIATLEKRLLQARRSSHSRISRAFSPTHKLNNLSSGGSGGSGGGSNGGSGGSGAASEEVDINTVLLEKDNEIADLRARLDDKDHMITALRSSARKRDIAERPSAERSVADRPVTERSVTDRPAIERSTTDRSVMERHPPAASGDVSPTNVSPSAVSPSLVSPGDGGLPQQTGADRTVSA